MKRLIPAIALLCVVALSAFTTVKAVQPNFSAFYKYVDGELLATDQGYISTNCTGGQVVCAVDVQSGSVAAAQSFLNNNTITFPSGNPIIITDFDPSTPGNQTMVVYPKPV